MRKVLLLLTLMIFSVAKAQYNVTGRVIDSDGLPVIQATVTLNSKTNTVKVQPVVTNNSGNFTVCGIVKGEYTLRISSIGYEPYESDLTVYSDIDMGTIRLDNASKMLDEVTVMANYSEVKQNGEITVRVKGNPLARGKSTADFLRLISGLVVNNNSISVRGRDNALIYIGDQQITFDQLKGIDPSMISKIEIIPYADGSYGVNASGGVIKIQLRKDAGVIGNVNVNSAVSQDGIPWASADATLLYTRGKLSMRNYISVPHNHNVARNRQDDISSDGVERKTYTKSVNDRETFYDNFALQYAFTKLDRLDVYGGVSLSWSDNTQNSTSGSSSLDINSKGRPAYYGVGVQYKRMFGKDSLSYFHFRSYYSRSNEYSRRIYISGGTADMARMQAYSDYISVRPLVHMRLKGNMTLNFGADYLYFADRHDNLGTEILNYIPTGRYDIEGPHYGAWADFSTMASKNLYLKVGVNYYGSVFDYHDKLDNANNISIKQDGFYPSLTAQWMFDKKKWRFLTLGYRHYYSNPNYNYRLPTVVWQNESRYSVGNPDLKKQDFDDVELYFSLNRNWSAFYDFNYADNLVNVLMHEDTDRKGVYYTRPENTGWRIKQKLGITYSGYIFRFWNTNTRLTGTNVRESMPGKRIDNAYLTFSSSNNFFVTKNLSFVLWFFAQSKTKSLSYESSACYGTSAGVNWSLLKDRLKINLNYNGILYNYGKTVTRGDGWTLSRKDLSHQTNVQLYVSWSFNAGKKIKNKDLPSASPGSDRQIPTF